MPKSEPAAEQLSWKYKGLPESALGLTAKEYLAQSEGLFADGYHWPQAVILEDALEHNLTTMKAFCEKHHVVLAPHVKTHMSPQIAHRQVDNGAWGVTVANASQARIFLEHGFRTIFIANEVATPHAITYLSEQDADIYFYVDSEAGCELVDKHATNPVNIVLEVGKKQGRTGLRDLHRGTELAKRIAASPKMRLAGVSGFEGTYGRNRSAGSVRKVRQFLASIVSFAREVKEYGESPFIVSAGGSAFFDLVVDEFAPLATDPDYLVVLRSGGYVVHDHGFYNTNYPFTKDPEFSFIPAIEVWSVVTSRPEKDLVIINGGKRDISVDIDMPFPLKWRSGDGQIRPLSGKVVRADDQHMYLRTDNKEVTVGDLVAFGISHPCTTFDKWPLMAITDSNYQIESLYTTHF